MEQLSHFLGDTSLEESKLSAPPLGLQLPTMWQLLGFLLHPGENPSEELGLRSAVLLLLHVCGSSLSPWW